MQDGEAGDVAVVGGEAGGVLAVYVGDGFGHAVGEGRTGEDIAAVGGANEGVDVGEDVGVGVGAVGEREEREDMEKVGLEEGAHGGGGW